MTGERRVRPPRDLRRSRVSRHSGDDDFRVPLPRPRRLRGALAAALLLGLLAGAAPARADCPGAGGTCPYVARLARSAQRGEGVLRFPQAVAVGPDGAIYVADQGSHVVQVFAPSGEFVREVGLSGTGPGQFTSVGAVAVAADGTLFVADGANRIDRFAPTGALIGSFGHGGSDRAGSASAPGAATRRARAAASPPRARSSTSPTPATTAILRFGLDGANPRILVPPGILDVPQGLAVRGTRVTVADDRNHRLVVFDTGGRMLGDGRRRQGRRPGPARASPTTSRPTPPGRLFVADDLNHRVVRFSAPPRYPYKGRWGAYGTAPGRLAYPRGIAVGAAGPDLRREHGQRPRRRVRPRRQPAGLVRRVGPLDRPVRRADGRRDRRERDPRRDRRRQRPHPAARTDRRGHRPVGRPGAGPDPPPQARRGRLRRRRQRATCSTSAAPASSSSTARPGRSRARSARRAAGPGRLLDPSALAIDQGGTISVADTGNHRVARFTLAGGRCRRSSRPAPCAASR